jgi:type I restriction-modification system DNA methylase subunit
MGKNKPQEGTEDYSEEIYKRFNFHPATEVTGPQHDEVRRQHRELAEFIITNVPYSREQSLALTALQESMMWCNAAVAYRT